MYALEDLHVRAEGTGRIVEAYAAVFNSRTEVVDQDGHYNETLPPTSFDRTIQHKAPSGFGVLFNHGRTVDGTPSDIGTVPIGVPLEVRADERGVFTATRYLDNPLADHVLDAIKAGAIRAQSFSGRFTKSSKGWPDGRGRSALPVITRHEVDMREYGPAVFAAYKDAAILGTRAEQFVMELLAKPHEDRLAWLEQFEGFTTPLPADPGTLTGTPVEGPAGQTEDPQPKGLHSARSIPLRARIHAARIVRGIE
jgi:HK97 family phage prohead protease